MTKRVQHDRYFTPPWVTKGLLLAWQPPAKSLILDPCCGQGHILKVFQQKLPATCQVFGTDLIETKQDYVSFLYKFPCAPDVIITNPPFSIALRVIRKSLTFSKRYVVMLLRLSFLGSNKRKTFWEQHPPSQILVLSSRPTFINGTADNSEYAWFVWDKKSKATHNLLSFIQNPKAKVA